MKLKAKEIQLPHCSGCATTWTRWSYFWKIVHEILTLPFRIVACALNMVAVRNKKKNEKYVHSKIDIAPDESGFWIRHIECGSQRASQHCDLLTKYFINFWTFWIWLLLLCTRGDGKQRRHSHGTGGLVWSVVGHGRCSQLTLLQWIHPSCTQTLWADEWTKSTTKTFFFLGKMTWETWRAWPMSHSHDNSTGFFSLCFFVLRRWH